VGVKIGVCNTGSGNLRSVERALRAAGADLRVEVDVTSDPDALAHADKIVVPGQGAFGDCARALAGPLGEVLRARMKAGVPYFGICLGMQVLFESSEEAPGCAGLGYFSGSVARLADVDPATGARLKIPHMGWNTAEPGAVRSLLPTVPTYFYFVHGYVVRPKDPSIVAATTMYGERFVSAVARDNVFACQFHPEKSQRAGLALLEKFLRT
jgi:glutamine amidotransferase